MSDEKRIIHITDSTEDEDGNIVFIGEVEYERRDPPDHDQWLRQIERVQKKTGS